MNDNLPIHNFLGLKLLAAEKDLVAGRMQVTQASMQPFSALHGGVSALIAESLASIGASIFASSAASKGDPTTPGQLPTTPVVGLDVQCSHLRGAPIGTVVLAVAHPLRQGRTVQVWEVRLRRLDDRAARRVAAVQLKAFSKEDWLDLVADNSQLVAIGRVTVVVGLGAASTTGASAPPFPDPSRGGGCSAASGGGATATRPDANSCSSENAAETGQSEAGAAAAGGLTTVPWAGGEGAPGADEARAGGKAGSSAASDRRHGRQWPPEWAVGSSRL